MLEEIGDLIVTTIWMAIGIAAIFALYVGIAAASAFVVRLITQGRKKEEGFNSLKTVTFGDESAVVSNRSARARRPASPIALRRSGSPESSSIALAKALSSPSAMQMPQPVSSMINAISLFGLPTYTAGRPAAMIPNSLLGTIRPSPSSIA